MNIFSFKGRTTRRVYWSMWVLNIILILAMRFGLHGDFSNHNPANASTGGIITVFIISILMLWWSLAIQVKRLHDLDKKGWWVILNLIPYVGSGVLMIYLGCFKGTDGENRFGAKTL